jgi:hypothetical protein
MDIFDYLKESDPISLGAIHRFLRYGPHTVIPEVEEQTREYLEKNGVPDWVKWDKDSLPCQNCTWFDGTSCRSGAHTCHYEFGYLICEMFCQSVTERKPSTVGDVCPSVPVPVDIKGICDDAYCPKCGRALAEKLADRDCPSCHAKLDWSRWHRMNDREVEL